MKKNLLLLSVWLISGAALAGEIHCDLGGGYYGLDISDGGQTYNIRVKNLDINPMAKQMGLPGAGLPYQYTDFEVTMPKSECLVSEENDFLFYCGGGVNSVKFHSPETTRSVHAVRIEMSQRYVESIKFKWGSGTYYDLRFLLEDETYPFFVHSVDYAFGSSSCRAN